MCLLRAFCLHDSLWFTLYWLLCSSLYFDLQRERGCEEQQSVPECKTQGKHPSGSNIQILHQKHWGKMFAPPFRTFGKNIYTSFCENAGFGWGGRLTFRNPFGQPEQRSVVSNWHLTSITSTRTWSIQWWRWPPAENWRTRRSRWCTWRTGARRSLAVNIQRAFQSALWGWSANDKHESQPLGPTGCSNGHKGREGTHYFGFGVWWGLKLRLMPHAAVLHIWHIQDWIGNLLLPGRRKGIFVRS